MVFATFSNIDEARKISKILLDDKVVACTNLIQGVSSHFWWRGSINNAKETLLIAKTEQTCFNRVESIIKKIHSYEVPEIIAVPILQGHEPYFKWISESVKEEAEPHR